jgi:hypothetical protein
MIRKRVEMCTEFRESAKMMRFSQELVKIKTLNLLRNCLVYSYLILQRDVQKYILFYIHHLLLFRSTWWTSFELTYTFVQFNARNKYSVQICTDIFHLESINWDNTKIRLFDYGKSVHTAPLKGLLSTKVAESYRANVCW